ncbi:MAG: hypothetical protein EOO65_01655 [Methanosarcinales archaeon]|nr:MAG: hypothetical protein EOO65_01655 [Methanosarcinales archaeon]
MERAVQTATRNNFQTPIDEIDAAARILDPVFQPLKDAEPPEGDGTCAPVFGAFLKDYFQSEW